MKTCHVCNKEYNWVSPLFALVKKGNSEMTRITNFCNISCLFTYATIEPEDDQGKLCHAPLDEMAMCQFCGTFTHASEFCKESGINEDVVEKFQIMGNCVGEHSDIKGYIVISNLGKNMALNMTYLNYTSQMVKINEDVKDRKELLYFWDDDVFRTSHVNSIKDDSISPIEHVKQFIVEAEMVPGSANHSSFNIFQRTTRIFNPHKLFFPFDIRLKNCWFPIYTEKTATDVHYNHEDYFKDAVVLFQGQEDSLFEKYEQFEDVKDLV